jgi:hypothetical protein
MRVCPFCGSPLTWTWDDLDQCESPRCSRHGALAFWLVLDSRGRIVAEATAHRVVLVEHLAIDLRALLAHVRP